MKPPARKSARKKVQRDYATLHTGIADVADAQRWRKMLEEKNVAPAQFRHMHGADVAQEWLETDPSAMTEPIIIDAPDGLGMKMPDQTITINDIAEMLGEDNPVEVIGAFCLLRHTLHRRVSSHLHGSAYAL